MDWPRQAVDWVAFSSRTRFRLCKLINHSYQFGLRLKECRGLFVVNIAQNSMGSQIPELPVYQIPVSAARQSFQLSGHGNMALRLTNE